MTRVPITPAVLLCVLALVDVLLAGFRAAAGRSGRIAKRAYYVRAVRNALVAGVLMVGGLVLVGATLAESASDPHACWLIFHAAATRLVSFYGTYATVTAAAFAVYFAPIGEARVLSSVIVFGPLTLLRRPIILAGLIVALFPTPTPRLLVMAACAAVAVLSIEHVLGRSYARQWRLLVGPRA